MKEQKRLKSPKHLKFIKATILLLLLISGILIPLWCAKWQYERALQKETIVTELQQQLKSDVVTKPLLINGSWKKQFYIIDNVYRHQQVGYELWQEFVISKTQKTLLITRGWFAKNTEREQLTAEIINNNINNLFWWKNFVNQTNVVDTIQIVPPLIPLLNSEKLSINHHDRKLISQGFEINNNHNVPEKITTNWQNWTFDEESILKRFSPHKHYSYMGQWLFFSCISLFALLFVLKKTFSRL